MTKTEQRKQTVIKDLNAAADKLHKCWQQLIELNKDGLQFDYVTTPDLATAASRCANRSGQIEKIVYQN